MRKLYKVVDYMLIIDLLLNNEEFVFSSIISFNTMI